MQRIAITASVAAVLALLQVPATAQQPAGAPAASPNAMMAKPGAAPKGILVETKDEALAQKLAGIVRGAPANSYRVEGLQTVQYGALPLSELQRTKETAASRIIIIHVGPGWRIYIVLGTRAAAYQQRVLQALAAADKGTYTLDQVR